MARDREISDALKSALKTICQEFDKEDEVVRQRQIRMWKKLEFMWAGFTRLWWDETAHDWRVYEDVVEGTDDQGYYDKNINVFRAYLESIIAAMSATVPGVKCKPDDANNVNDVLTAKGGTKIGQLIYSHIDAPLLWSKALKVYCTQGMVAAYNYADYNKKYGMVDSSDYDEVEENQNYYACSLCGARLDDINFQIAMQKEINEEDEFQPDNDDALLHSLIDSEDGKVICPQCQQMTDPTSQTDTVTVTRMVGITSKPKARQCVIIEGGLFVKVPNYARCQEEVPYLRYSYETHYSFVFKKYPKLRDSFKSTVNTQSGTDGNSIYDRWGRLSTQYLGEYPINTPTCNNWWVRPEAFETVNDDEVRKELYKKFPDGCKVVYVNEEFAEAKNESLDDHWTLTFNPLSEYLYFDPLGLFLTSIQEITNDIVALTLQTIEQGIPQTFADRSVLNFEAYRKTEVNPGDIFPVTPKSGKSLGEAFYEVKTATLSQEVGPFGEKIQELGQFVSGAMPSLFGGDQSNSSRTASQYAMSRAQSLQRLQTPWKMITYWWKDIFGKVIPQYIKTMLDDERIVKENGDNWINVVIKKSEMDGKIGSVELEAAEDLPMTSAQVRDMLMQLMQINNPAIIAALSSPDNLPLLYEAGGLNDFVIPGEADREKQLEEIQLLIQSQPIPNVTMGPDGQPQDKMMPSVDIEPLVDSHDVQAAVCRSWLVSEAGRQCKIDNQAGYQNVLAHMQAHMDAMQALQMMNAPQQQPGENSNNPNPPNNKTGQDLRDKGTGATKGETQQSQQVM